MNNITTTMADCVTVHAGAEYTTSKRKASRQKGFFCARIFLVLGLGSVIRKDAGMACFMYSTPVPPCDDRKVVFLVKKEI